MEIINNKISERLSKELEDNIKQFELFRSFYNLFISIGNSIKPEITDNPLYSSNKLGFIWIYLDFMEYTDLKNQLNENY